MADDTESDGGTQPPDFNLLINQFGFYLANGLGLGGYMDWAINNVAKAAQVVKGVGLKTIPTVLSATGSAVKAIIEGEEQVAAPLAAWTLGLIFGRDAGAMFGGAAAGGSVQDGADAVGAAVLDAVFGPLSLDGGSELTPGVERAEGYLGAITNMVMRGFLVDVASEFVPELGLHFVVDLEKELISGLGLGRIARTVLRPIVTTLVADPAQWAVNLAYRPKLLSEGDAVKLWELGVLDDGALDDELGRQGWSSQRIEGFKDLHLKPADFGAMTTLLDHQIVSEDDVVNSLLHTGFLQTAAAAKVQAHKLARLDPWLLKAADVWLQKYSDGLIDASAFRANLTSVGLPDDVAQLLMNIGGAHRETPRKLLSSAELIEAWNNNILTQNDVHDGLILLGYSETDATTKILTVLAVGRHKSEVADQKAAALAARAAAVAAAKAEKAAEQQAARLAAAAARLAKQQAAAAAKAQALQDAETLRQFISDTAAQRRQLVDAQHQAGAISKDQADALKAGLAANEAQLLAAATVAAKNADVEFDQQILDLKISAATEDYETQLADVDLSLEEDAQARAAAVAVRVSTVNQLLALALADVDDLFAQRAANAADDLTAALAAVDAAVLPTQAERSAKATEQITELDAALTRKLADIADHYAQLQQTVDDELAAKTITDKAAANAHDRLTNAQAQAERLATQQHDLGVQRLQDVAAAADALDVATAAKDKLTIETAAAKAARTLAADKLKADQSAQHTADAETIRLQAIGAQTAPATAAAAAKKRATINAAIAKLQASQAVQAATIQKAAADATATITKAQTAVDAAKERAQLLTSTSAQRETAAAAATAQLEAFDAASAAAKDAIEQTILSHRVGTLPA